MNKLTEARLDELQEEFAVLFREEQVDRAILLVTLLLYDEVREMRRLMPRPLTYGAQTKLFKE